MDDAFNKNLCQLMNTGNNRDGTNKKGFGLGINKLITKRGAEKVLFDKNRSCVKMTDEVEYEPVIAFVNQLVYDPF